MPLQLLPLVEADLPAFFTIMWEAGQDDPISKLMWPDGYPSTARDWSVARSTEDMRNNTGTDYFMKVIDTDLPDGDPYGKILSIALWQVYPQHRTDEELEAAKEKAKARGFPPAADVAFLEDFYGGQGKAKAEIMGGKAHVYLALLFTLPKGFRRGAGTMHLQWGLELADKLGVPAYLEASQMGRPLYERNGFEFVQLLPVDSERWGLDPATVTCLLRPGRKVGNGVV